MALIWHSTQYKRAIFVSEKILQEVGHDFEGVLYKDKHEPTMYNAIFCQM